MESMVCYMYEISILCYEISMLCYAMVHVEKDKHSAISRDLFCQLCWRWITCLKRLHFKFIIQSTIFMNVICPHNGRNYAICFLFVLVLLTDGSVIIEKIFHVVCIAIVLSFTIIEGSECAGMKIGNATNQRIQKIHEKRP